MKKWMIILGCIILIILLISLISSFVSTGPFSGIVLNGLTGEPISNIKVFFEANARCFFALDTCFVTIRDETTYTNKNGEFEIPRKLNLLFTSSRFYSEQLSFNSKDKIHFYDSINNDYLIYRVTYMEKPWANDRPDNEFFSLKSKPKELSISLIPGVESIEECNNAQSIEIKNDCIALNAYDVALSTLNRNLCNSILDTRNRNICLNELDPNKEKYDACNCFERYGVQQIYTRHKDQGDEPYPEQLNEITRSENLCIAFCSWMIIEIEPQCDKIMDDKDKRICLEIH